MARARKYEDIQMRDLAAEAEVSRATLYRYFTTREEVYAALTVDWGRSFLERLRQSSAAPRSPRARVHWVLGAVLDEAASEPRLIRAFLVVLLEGEPMGPLAKAPVHALLPLLLGFAGGDSAELLDARTVRLLQHVLLATLFTMQRGDVDVATAREDLRIAIDRLWPDGRRSS